MESLVRAAEHLPIRAVASLTGVKPITLRAWERRYGLFKPVRTATGHRMYTHAQVEMIRRAVALTERGVPIGQVREALQATEPAAPARADPWRERLDRMVAAIARFDEAELDRLEDEAVSIHSVDRVTQRLLIPLLAHLGERWQDAKGAIAEEHFFATYMRSKLGARLLHRARHSQGPRIVAACAPGELHEIGLLLFCLEAAESGLRPVVLGADTPFTELVEARKRCGAEGIVVSCSIDPAAELIPRELGKLVRAAGVPVFVGGAAAAKRRAEISSAGAIPVGGDIRDGVQLVRTRLAQRPASSR